MISRLYIIEYDIIANMYGIDIKGSKPNKEHRVEIFKINERNNFTERYLDLKNKYYIENIETGYAETNKIVDMDKIINVL